jgi:hypothetical protein
MICQGCGNVILHYCGGDQCLVCVASGRDSSKYDEFLLKAQAAAIDAVMSALQSPARTVEQIKEGLSAS